MGAERYAEGYEGDQLSRALKLKNRVVHRLSQLDRLIISYNNTLDDNQEYDVKDLYKVRADITQFLINLKTAINAANQPVQSVIFELAEAKSLIAMLGKIDTKNGPQLEGYSGVRVKYVVQLRQVVVDREIKRVEQHIDRLQTASSSCDNRSGVGY